MFKEKSKVWKSILAAALAACMMLPTAVFADGEATENKVTDLSASYDVVNGTVTVTGNITVGADLTILAVRCGAGELTGTTNNDKLADVVADETITLQDRVAYIDQFGAEDTAVLNAETGAFSFTFIPKSGAKGGQNIAVFAGGTDVAAVALKEFTAVPKGPFVALAEGAKWYKGEKLVLNMVTAGDGPYGAAKNDDFEITGIKVNGTALEYTDYVIDYENAKITITTTEAITTVDVVMNDSYGDTTTTFDTALAQVDKEAGKLTAVAQVADGTITVAVDATGAHADWAAAIESAVFVGDSTITGAAYAEGTLTVPYNMTGLTETVTVKVAPENFAVAEATDIALTAPTQATVDEIAKPNTASYHATEYVDTGSDAFKDCDDADKQAQFGAAYIVLEPTYEKYQTQIAWTVTKVAGSEVTVEHDLKTYKLERPLSTDEENDYFEYKVVGTVTKDPFAPATIAEFTVKSGKCGVAGVDLPITLTFDAGYKDAAALATVTVDGVEATASENVFTAAAVTDGSHTVVVARPGYVTQTITVVLEGGVVTSENTTVAMIAGDITNAEGGAGDGQVENYDYMALATAWETDKATLGDAFADNCDFNGDGLVESYDYMALATYWQYGVE